MKKNDRVILEIEDMTNLGAGVAHCEGMAVFVNGAVTGDRIDAKIIKVTKSYAVARCEELIAPSPERSEERECPVSGRCGGCAYRNINREFELKIKRNTVLAALRRAGLPDIEVEETLTDGRCERYRNKAQYPVAKSPDGAVLIGFYSQKTHRVIDTPDCRQTPESFSQITGIIRKFITENGISVYDEESGKGLFRHIYLRSSEDGRVMVCAVVNGRKLPKSELFCELLTSACPKISGILLNINERETNVVLGDEFVTLWGSPYIEDTLCGLRVRLSPDSFYQVNHGGAELLYGKALEKAGLSGNETLLDLYCGAGTIGLSMAKSAGRVFGVDIVPAAIENARFNAERNGIGNADFAVADAGDAAAMFAAARHSLGENFHADAVIFDPPRKGCTEELLRAVAEHSPEKIVYVSCNPDTLARDMAILTALGYTAGAVTPVDLFPGTGHVESVALMSKVK